MLADILFTTPDDARHVPELMAAITKMPLGSQIKLILLRERYKVVIGHDARAALAPIMGASVPGVRADRIVAPPRVGSGVVQHDRCRATERGD